MEQELPDPPEHMSSPKFIPDFSWFRVTRSLGFVDRCLSFVDLRILITTLVSSNYSYIGLVYCYDRLEKMNVGIYLNIE